MDKIFTKHTQAMGSLQAARSAQLDKLEPVERELSQLREQRGALTDELRSAQIAGKIDGAADIQAQLTTVKHRMSACEGACQAIEQEANTGCVDDVHALVAADKECTKAFDARWERNHKKLSQLKEQLEGLAAEQRQLVHTAQAVKRSTLREMAAAGLNPGDLPQLGHGYSPGHYAPKLGSTINPRVELPRKKPVVDVHKIYGPHAGKPEQREVIYVSGVPMQMAEPVEADPLA